MTIYLRQSTASQEVLLGPFVDSTDGVTAKTALSIANTDIKLWMAGATTLANKNSGGATHISNGNYYAVLDATDTATIGSGAIIVQVAGALAFRLAFTVLPPQVFDSLVLGSDLLDISVVQFAGSAITSAAGIPEVKVASLAANAITATSIATDAITAAKIAADAIGASELAADAVAEIQSGLATSSALSTVAGYIDTEVAAILAAVDTEIAAIKAKTDNLPADPADASDIAASFATVNTKLDTIDDFLDTEISALTTAVDAIPTNAELATALGTADDAVLAAIAALNNISPAGVRSAVGLASANLDTQIATLATAAVLSTVAGYLDTEVAAILAAVDTEINTLLTAVGDVPTNAELATALGTADDAVLAAIAALNNLSSAQVTAAVPTAVQNADALLGRTISGGANGGRDVTSTLRAIRNKQEITAGTATVYAEDDTTPAWTATVTTAAGDPIVSVDPS